jgi:hypothetical protein
MRHTKPRPAKAGFCLLYTIATQGNQPSPRGEQMVKNALEDLLFWLILIVVVAAFFALRIWLGLMIAKAARRRIAGYGGWFVASLLIGVLPTWLVYLFCVHGRPVVLDD